MIFDFAKKFDIFHTDDKRGSFTKIISENDNILPGYNLKWSECYISKSNKGTVRGMHFQLPPLEHHKIVFCLSGKIFDVCIDLRSKSEEFGKLKTFTLNGDSSSAIYVPPGYAHGFQSLDDNTKLLYLVTTSYDPALDTGLNYLSFNIDWPIEVSSISDRDSSFEGFDPKNVYFT